MKPIIKGVLASIAVLGLVASCSDDKKASDTSGATGASGVTLAPGETAATTAPAPTLSLPPGVTLPTAIISLPPGVTLPTLPPGLTIPPGGTFPPDMSIPTQVIDVMIAQLQAAGMNVDRACLEALLNDSEFRSMVMSGTTPTADMIQSLVSCLRA